MFTLKKINIMEGQLSIVDPGYSRTGRVLSLLTPSTSQYTHIDSIDDVEVGKQVLLTSGVCDYLRTSPVSEILERGRDFIRFRTQTSIYELTKTKG